MATYLLELSDRQETIGFLSAGAAYRWLDVNGAAGEQYTLGYSSGHPSAVELIDAGLYRLPDSRRRTVFPAE